MAVGSKSFRVRNIAWKISFLRLMDLFLVGTSHPELAEIIARR